jgi:hypothetical protein
MLASERVFYDPIFNYKTFLPADDHPGQLCDCTLALPGGIQLEAHQIVLANSSQFFLNAFTSGMSEQETRTVTVGFNPCGLFPSVLHWMYTGEIEATPDTIMPLIAMARFFGIEALVDNLSSYFAVKIEPDLECVRQCVRQCYELELPTALEFLIPTISRNLEEPDSSFDMSWLSDALDVATFYAVIQGTGADLSQKVHWATEFLGDYEMQPHEKEVLHQIFAGRTAGELDLIFKYARDAAWISREIIEKINA